MNVIKTSKYALLLSPALLLAPCLASAETATAAMAPTPTTGVNEVIVTAEKRSERLVKVPISVVVKSGDQLTAAGVTNMRDLTLIAPSLTFTAFNGYVQPSIRGVSSSGTGSGDAANVAIYLDGVYQPNQLVNAFDLPDVSRVEVDSGPQGTLFGRNATGGAIQIFTLDPTFTPKLSLSDMEGIYHGGGIDSILSAHVSGPLVGNTVAGALTGYYRTDQGYIRDLLTGRRIGIDHDVVLRGKLLVQPTPKLQFLLTGYYSDNVSPVSNVGLPYKDNTLGRSFLVQTPAPPYSYQGDAVPQFVTKTWGASVKATYEADAGSLTSLTSYSVSEIPLPNAQDADDSPLPVLSFAVFAMDTTYAEDLNFTSRKFGRFSFVVGGNYYADDDKGDDPIQLIFGSGPTSYSLYEYGRATTSAYAVYADFNYNITDKFLLIGGFRYSSESKTNYGETLLAANPSGIDFKIPGASHTWTAPTGRASLQYSFTPNTNVYFTFSQGFKSGVYNGGSAVPIDPEHINAYEVGFKTQADRYSVELAGFYYDYSDLQVESFTGTTIVVQSAVTATIGGLELDGTLKVTDDVRLIGGLTWLPEAKYGSWPVAQGDVPLPTGGNLNVSIDASGRRMIRAPVFAGNISPEFDHTYSWGHVSANVTLYYATSYNFTVDERLQEPASLRLNAQASWSPPNSGFKLTVWGRNLTNALTYNSMIEDAFADVAVVAPPLEAGVTVAYKY